MICRYTKSTKNHIWTDTTQPPLFGPDKVQNHLSEMQGLFDKILKENGKY